MMMNEEIKTELDDIVSPYQIRNLTDRPIKVYSLTDDNMQTGGYTEIAAGARKDLVVAISSLE